MKVLQVYKTPFPDVRGGVDVVVRNLLIDRGRHFEALLLRTAAWNEPGVRVSVHDDVQIISMHFPLPPSRIRSVTGWLFFLTRAPVAFLRLRRELWARGVQLVHLHTLQHYQLYFLLCRLFGGPPYVLTLHRAEVLAYASRSRITKALWRRILLGAVAVTAVSTWLATEARHRFPFVRSILCITNGVDFPDTPLPNGREIALTIGVSRPYFVTLGVLEHYKGHDVALRAWPGISDEIDLIVIGDGSCRERYHSLAAELGISARVHFTGRLGRDAALALLGASLGLIMPSRSEGLPLAVLESGVVGAPVIGSDIGPFREVITDGVTGLLFPVEDVAALRSAVDSLISDPMKRQRLGNAFRAHVRERYSSERSAGEYAALYRCVLRGHATVADACGPP